MAKETKKEPQIILEREYIIPLRKSWLKVARYKRANKAVKTIKEFIARHMKIYDRDLKKVKIDIFLNNEIRFRGLKKPPAKIKVKAKKFDNEIVKVELLELPEHIKYLQKRKEEKKKQEEEKKSKEEKKEEKKEDLETEEKKEAVKEDMLKLTKEQARETKHLSKEKAVVTHRKALAK